MTSAQDVLYAPGEATVPDMLGGWYWFQTLPTPDKDRLIQDCFHRDIPADGYACQAGEPVNYWVGIISGLAKLSVMKENGRSAGLAGVPGGGWFGEGSLLKRTSRAAMTPFACATAGSSTCRPKLSTGCAIPVLYSAIFC